MRTYLLLRATSAVALLALFPACVQELKPPAPPQPSPPRFGLPKTPPASGYGRVYIDVPEGATTVDRVLGTGTETVMVPVYVAGLIVMTQAQEAVDRTQRLCVTPCILDLPLGGQELTFTLRSDTDRSDRTPVLFSDTPSAYVHTVGRQERKIAPLVGGAVVLGFGVAGVLTSPILFAANKDEAGTIFLAGGAGLTALGSLILYLARPTTQPGAGTPWVPAEWSSPAKPAQ